MKALFTRKDAKDWLDVIRIQIKNFKNFNAYEVSKIPSEHQTVSTKSVVTRNVRKDEHHMI